MDSFTVSIDLASSYRITSLYFLFCALLWPVLWVGNTSFLPALSSASFFPLEEVTGSKVVLTVLEVFKEHPFYPIDSVTDRKMLIAAASLEKQTRRWLPLAARSGWLIRPPPVRTIIWAPSMKTCSVFDSAWPLRVYIIDLFTDRGLTIVCWIPHNSCWEMRCVSYFSPCTDNSSWVLCIPYYVSI